jgi:hypothetical protein
MARTRRRRGSADFDPTFAGEVKIDDLIVAKTIPAAPAAQRDATVKAAKAFYQFWNNGAEASLKPAI